MMTQSRSDLWNDRIEQEGAERHEMHKHQASSRPLSKDYHLVGLAGETAFGRFSGRMPDLEQRIAGDDGFDFIISLKFTVDVKTFRKAYHLIQEQGKVTADIYVLAEYDDETRNGKLLGWEWGRILAKAPLKDFGYGIITHYIKTSDLRPMSELKERMLCGY